MPDFIHEDFLLESAAAKRLYHDYAAKMPIIDYHNHLSPAIIANNLNFSNITEAWVDGDHYKWRAMRTNGMDEKYMIKYIEFPLLPNNDSDWYAFSTNVPKR